MEVGERVLVVQRASVGAKPGQVGSGNSPYEQYPEIPRPILPAGDLSQTSARILLMLNMVTPDDLVDDEGLHGGEVLLQTPTPIFTLPYQPSNLSLNPLKQ